LNANACTSHVDPVSTLPKVGKIAGRFPKWRALAAARRVRAIAAIARSLCESCHTQARNSSKTSDVLIPTMKSCTPCHGASGTTIDNCTTCHQYHNRTIEIGPGTASA